MLFDPTPLLPLFFLSLSGIANALPSEPEDARLEPRLAAAQYICETSAASPPVTEVNATLEYFSRGDVGITCTRDLPYLGKGPDCLIPIGVTKARVSICDSYGRWLTCKDVAAHGQILIEKCAQEIGGVKRVGGKVLLPKGMVVNVYGEN
ncbi:hypothetical protein L873DRAFT_1811761 [Choiromyces venosus 120613-1]|uniref:Cyanovirin-N domain-containing protein n=1 Tax=Choiromyces venosus 120613-1 TaxID=1336337 RepID=A0A3N4JGN2_9PEZI|nr:hypothetical protein L873DRAFT_1811761 [Choiromyces venosus 120613-1]